MCDDIPVLVNNVDARKSAAILVAFATATLLITSPVTAAVSAAATLAGQLVDSTTSSVEPRHWFPFHPVRDEFKPTILDCSRWVEAPTGKHGFVMARGDRFVFDDGTPVRFWGAQMDLWSKAETDYAVRRMRRQGINITRQHGMESLGRDAQSFERLDYLIAKLGENGIYLILDLHYPLNYRFSADDHISGLPNGGAAPHAEFFDDRVVELMHRRMTNIYTHLNPYTGKRYCDDPTLALVEILNEDSLFWGTIAEPFRAELEDKFADWLRKKYGDDAGLRRAWTAGGTVGLADGEGLGPSQRIGLMRNWDFTEKYYHAHPEHCVRGQDQMRFFYELEDRYWTGCRAVLRRAGIRVPIAATNWQGHGFPTRVHMLGQAKLDYIDRHGYWDHPQGEGIRKWRIATAEFHDLPMVKAVRADQDLLVYLGVENLVTEKAWEQVLGMPMTISEWNTCLPNEYSLEGTGLMAAYGSLQGWDGSLEFGYFSPDWPRKLGPGSFDLLGNPPQILQFPAASVMWLRQDVKEAEVVAESLYDPETVFGLNEDRKPVPLAAALVGKVGYRFVESHISRGHMSSDPELGHLLSRPAGTLSSAGSGGGGRGEEAPFLTSLMEKHRPPVVKDISRYWDATNLVARSITGELTWDAKQGFVRINTPRTQAVIGFLSVAPQALEAVRVQSPTPFGAIYVTAMDGYAAISSARRLLLTAVGPVRNTGMEYETTTQPSRLGAPLHRLRTEGAGPALLEAVTGTIEIRHRHPEILKCWALDAVGQRVREIPLARDGNRVRLRMQAEYETVYYELSAE